MFQRNRNCFFAIQLFLIVFSGHFSNASTEGVRSDNSENYFSPVQVKFTGQVKFESRYTRVHHFDDGGEVSGQKSQIYWSLVIASQGRRYVFSKVFNLGDVNPPEFIELGGSTLKAGSLVRVDGQVMGSNEISYFLMNISSIQVITDAGWICHSVSAENPNISVQVWYDLSQGEGTTKIRVEQSCGRSIYPIATVLDASATLNEKNIVYSGNSGYSGQSTQGSKIVLHIETLPHQALDLSSSLKIETINPGRGDQSGVEALIPLKCSQARLSTGD